MADAFTWVIRFVHIFSGVMWVGGIFLWGMVIAPAILRRGPPMIRRPFLEAVLGRIMRYFTIAGSLTIVSGFWVMGLIVGFDRIGDTFETGSYGIGLGVGVVAALAMMAIGLGVTAPAGRRLLAAMQAMPAPVPGAAPAQPPAQIVALGKRIAIASMSTLLLGVVALGAMAWAVNAVR